MRGEPRKDGMAQSLIIKRQRTVLDEIGRQVGTPVVYLKAAWADPVLYGGRGQRVGCDVDILVRPDRFVAFAQELEGHGFHRIVSPTHPATNDASKEWLLSGRGQTLDVDLHRGLAEEPWFRMDPVPCIERSQQYDSVDGPILSLCPDDQVVFAAAHYANHRFDLDQKHLEDTRQLLAAFTVNWQEMVSRARQSHLLVPLYLLVEALAGLGARVPADLFDLGLRERLRLGCGKHLVSTDEGLGRHRHWGARIEHLTLMPWLSGRPAVLPLFVSKYIGLRIADLARRLFR